MWSFDPTQRINAVRDLLRILTALQLRELRLLPMSMASRARCISGAHHHGAKTVVPGYFDSWVLRGCAWYSPLGLELHVSTLAGVLKTPGDAETFLDADLLWCSEAAFYTSGETSVF